MKSPTFSRRVMVSQIATVLAARSVAAQDIPSPDTVNLSDVSREVPIESGDVEKLVANLAGGPGAINRVRVFSEGTVLEGYPDSPTAFQAADGLFDAESKSLVVRGALMGTPAIEDIRVIGVEGQVYVLRDIHLSGDMLDVV